jgi:hypothetical protein
LGQTLSKNVNYGLTESFWQFEFYRIATLLLPQKNYISPEVGRVFGDNKKLDFYITDRLLRLKLTDFLDLTEFTNL